MPVKGILRTCLLAATVLGCITACVPAVVNLVSGSSLEAAPETASIAKAQREVPVVAANFSTAVEDIRQNALLRSSVPTEYDTLKTRETEVPPVALPETVKVPEQPEAQAPSPGKIGMERQILAFYGKPGAKTMGILGEYTKEQIAPLLEGYGKLYDDANGELGVIPAFYIIFGTCWPEGEIGKLSAKVVEEYIAFAAEKGWLVFLDHQIGKYTVEDSIKSMFPYLKYPNVHLALDPEWRTLKPMKEIGSIDAKELNRAQELMNDYLVSENLPGDRMLVVHQFKPKMILNRDIVRSDFKRVTLVHTADGFGAPPLKRLAYKSNAEATNMPVKGFKLFFESKVIGAGWDKPLMTPDEVMLLNPMPMVIMYQ